MPPAPNISSGLRPIRSDRAPKMGIRTSSTAMEIVLMSSAPERGSCTCLINQVTT